MIYQSLLKRKWWFSNTYTITKKLQSLGDPNFLKGDAGHCKKWDK